MTCEKKSFSTDRAALNYARGSRRIVSIAGLIRAYLCPYCSMYHLTKNKFYKKKKSKKSRNKFRYKGEV